MDLELLSTSDPTWPEVLARSPHDVYHLPGYVDVEARRVAGRATAALVRRGEQTLLVPLLLVPQEIGGRERGSEGALDALSPYGYPSPLLHGDEEFADRAIEVLRTGLAARGVAAAFVRTHPLLPLAPALARHGVLVHQGETVWMDLTLSDEELWSQTRPRERTYINRLKDSGLVAHLDPAFAHYERFLELYRSTMSEVAAASWYFFSREYFDELRAALGPALLLCVVETPTGEIVNASLFTEYLGIVQYHLSGTTKLPELPDATKLMLHFMRGLAKQRGNRAFHLGGGRGAAADSLFRFKSGFSKLRGQFHTWRLVCDQRAFDAGLARWSLLAGEPSGPLTGYFPPYRRPLPGPVSPAG